MSNELSAAELSEFVAAGTFSSSGDTSETPIVQPAAPPAQEAGSAEKRYGRSQVDRRMQEWKTAFLVSYKATSDIVGAREAAHVTRRAFQAALEKDPAFRDAVTDALADRLERVEDAFTRRAIKGSDKAALAILQAYDPERWQEKAREIALKNDVEVHVILHDVESERGLRDSPP